MRYLLPLVLLLSLISPLAIAQPVEPLPLPQAQITLSWTTPVARENGDALPVGEIAGYEIYAVYPDGVSETIIVTDGAAVSQTLAISHGSGVYSFSIVTLDVDGLMSKISPAVSSTVGENSLPLPAGAVILKVVCQAGAVCNFYEMQ
jgi:hypothetical protein